QIVSAQHRRKMRLEGTRSPFRVGDRSEAKLPCVVRRIGRCAERDLQIVQLLRRTAQIRDVGQRRLIAEGNGGRREIDHRRGRLRLLEAGGRGRPPQRGGGGLVLC